MTFLKYLQLQILVVFLTTAAATEITAQSTVALNRTEGRFKLTLNGHPYRIKGVGGTSRFQELAAAGGNSVRTWGTEGVEKLLDEAHELGLTVCVGMWLQHERHGFDYGDATAVQRQRDKCLADVRRLKDHPAVLIWGIGNEMEADGNNPEIWAAVNDIARDIKAIDPNHPTMTVIAELGEGETKIRNLDKHCPDVDIIGVNSYGGIPTLAKRFLGAGVSKPYIVTEHGPMGPWETASTPWGSPIEATSTEKGRSFADGYRTAVLEQPDTCLGSYAFLWGNKQETTATWFGMLLPDGTRLAAVDVMSQAWTGSTPVNRCPEINRIVVSRTENVEPGSTIQASVSVSDPEDDSLRIEWLLRNDSGTIGTGGDAQKTEALVNAGLESDHNKVSVSLPDRNARYRLYAYVYDDQGGAAVANVPISVASGLTVDNPGRTVTLPFVVYGDGASQNIFVPSGFMGNSSSVAMTPDSKKQPHSGTNCLKAEYQSSDDWGGVLWQSPAGDWDGVKPGGANLDGATHLEFWVRGERGGEIVNFVFGVLDGDQPFRDTAKGELPDQRLRKEWQKMSIPLTGKNLTRIKTGFGWSLAGQGQPVTFYLDDIRFVKQTE